MGVAASSAGRPSTVGFPAAKRFAAGHRWDIGLCLNFGSKHNLAKHTKVQRPLHWDVVIRTAVQGFIGFGV